MSSHFSKIAVLGLIFAGAAQADLVPHAFTSDFFYITGFKVNGGKIPFSFVHQFGFTDPGIQEVDIYSLNSPALTICDTPFTTAQGGCVGGGGYFRSYVYPANAGGLELKLTAGFDPEGGLPAADARNTTAAVTIDGIFLESEVRFFDINYQVPPDQQAWLDAHYPATGTAIISGTVDGFYKTTITPEPSMYVLLGLGLLGLVAIGKARSDSKSRKPV